MTEASPATVLCVDDDPSMLASLSMLLRRRYEVLTAGSGVQALQLLRERPDVAVILSDMRMPGMDGATFLREARALLPDTPRLLLTGHANVESAIAAVNDGQIFRFLVKPCPPPAMMTAIDAAARQYRLLTAERVLLSETLKGAVKALSDVLALTSPAAFGHAAGIKQLAGEIAQRLMPEQRWAIEVAAMLAPLGSIALPPDVAEKLHDHRTLDADEQAMVDRIPKLSESLLSNIPRLELVRSMLALLQGGPAATPGATLGASIVRRGVAILRAALDYDALEAEGHAPADALALLRARRGAYDADALEAMDAVRGTGSQRREIREIPAAALRPGMIVAADIRLASGVLMVARGFEVTPGLVERIRNLRPGALAAPVRVYAAAAAD